MRRYLNPIARYWVYRLFFFWFWGVAMTFSVQAQTPMNCTEVDITDISSTPATCPGNGMVTVPEVENSYFTLKGPGLDGEIQQSSNVFESLVAGTFTLSLYCQGLPVREFQVEVEDKHNTLDFTLASEMVCQGGGKITVTPMGGFNQGGEGVIYQFAS